MQIHLGFFVIALTFCLKLILIDDLLAYLSCGFVRYTLIFFQCRWPMQWWHSISIQSPMRFSRHLLSGLFLLRIPCSPLSTRAHTPRLIAQISWWRHDIMLLGKCITMFLRRRYRQKELALSFKNSEGQESNSACYFAKSERAVIRTRRQWMNRGGRGSHERN